MDRGQAVNLAKHVLSEDAHPTLKGVQALAKAVLEMDAKLEELQRPSMEEIMRPYRNTV